MFIQQERLDSLIKLWELLLSKSAEKGRMLLFTQKRVHFLRETEEVMSWILEKVRSCLPSCMLLKRVTCPSTIFKQKSCLDLRNYADHLLDMENAYPVSAVTHTVSKKI